MDVVEDIEWMRVYRTSRAALLYFRIASFTRLKRKTIDRKSSRNILQIPSSLINMFLCLG